VTTAQSGVSRGKFVVFEGPEGAGKSTQLALLRGRLTAAGRDPVFTREPGGTPTGDAIRSVVLDPQLRVDPLTEFLLYSAGRAQHVADVIAPALAAGRDVVSDRFTAASVAYQGYGRGLELQLVERLNLRVTNGLTPDLTVFWTSTLNSVSSGHPAARSTTASKRPGSSSTGACALVSSRRPKPQPMARG